MLFAVAVTLAAAPFASPRMPRFSWDTLPVAYHSSNVTGMYSDDEIQILAKYAAVTLEKWQGIHEIIAPGYNLETCASNFTNLTLCGCCTEDLITEVGRKVKAIDNTTMVIGYDHSNKVYGMYRSARAFAQHPEFWLYNASGVLEGDGNYLFVDHGKEAAGKLWAEGCLNMTATGYVDACFMDGCGKCEATLSPSAHQTFMSTKLATMRSLQQQIPGPLICGSNGDAIDGIMASQIQNWGKGGQYSTREIPMLQKAMHAGVMFEAHGRCPTNATDPAVVTSLAAFLVAAGEYSYYMCQGWNGGVPTWFPVYDYPLGAPLSNATLSKGVYTRHFSKGTVVTFDTNSETGTIEWGK